MKNLLIIPIYSLVFLAANHVLAAKNLPQDIDRLRNRIFGLEQQLVIGLKTHDQTKTQIQKIRELISLQKKESRLLKERLAILEKTKGDLEARRGDLRERVLVKQNLLRKQIIQLHRVAQEERMPDGIKETDLTLDARKRILSKLTTLALQELEEVQIDLSDSDRLEQTIEVERGKIAYHLQDLEEQKGILELNRELQADLLTKRHTDRVVQLEEYQKLKSAEGNLTQMMSEFHARLELDKIQQAEKEVARMMGNSNFAKGKGRFLFPLEGQVVSSFGKSYDPQSRLKIFKKGIEIVGGKKSPVRAVHDGRVAYSGVLPNYGNVTIVDHGESFYTVSGRLGTLERKVGEEVKSGSTIGLTDDSGTPVYFEIRSGNIALNPLQWLRN